MQTLKPPSSNQRIQLALRERRHSDVNSLLSKYLGSLSAAELGSIGMQIRALSEGVQPLLEIVLMSSSQPMDLANILQATLAAAGMPAVIHDTGFDQWRFVLPAPVEPPSDGATRIQVCLLDASLAYPRMAICSDLERLERVLASTIRDIENCLQNTSSTGNFLVLNTVPVPACQLDVHLDFRSRARAAGLWNKFNGDLLELVELYSHVQVLDANHVLQGRLPDGRFWDSRMATLAGVHWTPEAMRAFSVSYARTARAILGGAKKCLILDLDNTLWGGILGDDGIEGVELEDGACGNAYLRMQQAASALGNQGVILAINSKNEKDLVEQCFSQRAMPLKLDHFAVIAANWQPKHDNLRTIVGSLNIQEDSVVFVDDNPFECELVRGACPSVLVLEVGEEPDRAVEILLSEGIFDKVSVTADDKARNQSYVNERNRAELMSNSQDYDEYLKNLGLVVSVKQLDRGGIQRSAQLSQRTNQFNLSGRRYTEADLTKRSESPNFLDLLFTVEDRFGDYGVTGAVYAQRHGDILNIENMVLSCRVFSRGVEHFMVAEISEQARRIGCAIARACYVASTKNRQFSGFYERAGFEPADSEEPGNWFNLQLVNSPKPPHWILRSSVEKI